VRQEEGGAGEQDRRGLAHSPLKAEDDAGDDARQRARQDHLADGLPLRPAQRDADHAELIGHAAHGFFGGADNDRQGHDRERERGGDDADAEVEEEHEQPQPEQPINDRRHTGQTDDGDADQARPPVVAGVFRQVDAGGDAERDRDQAGADHQIDRADDGG